MATMIRALFSFAVFLFVAMPGALAQMAVEDLTVVAGAKSYAFKVEVANKPDQIQQGMMFRDKMEENTGMLFDFGEPREANMWMKNVILPLDMLFVDTDGTIVAIAHNAVPGSLRRINPGVAVKGVVELKGGRAKSLGIEPGHSVKHKIFEPAK